MHAANKWVEIMCTVVCSVCVYNFKLTINFDWVRTVIHLCSSNNQPCTLYVETSLKYNQVLALGQGWEKRKEYLMEI